MEGCRQKVSSKGRIEFQIILDWTLAHMDCETKIRPVMNFIENDAKDSGFLY